MTTAEFIIGHSADDAADRRQEARKILWALLAALLIHLVIGYALATFNGLFSSAAPVEEKPMELTIVDLTTPAPVVPKNAMFMETDESKQPAEQPKEKTFESNANSIAASQLPATGDIPLPSQQGKERPLLDLETHQYSLANQGAQPQPSAAPQQTPMPSAAPRPTPIPEAEQLAMLTSTTPPAIQPTVAAKPQQPQSSYRAQKEQTRLSGRITSRGISSVNAVGTPLGRYEKVLFAAIGSRWYPSVETQRDLINIGTARVVFSVDRSGRVRNLKLIENSSNEAFANICIQSVQEAQFPPMSDDLAATLPSEGLEVDLPFTIFAN
jgi:outer membrane biosynthesis protein TonB